ncbi:MAG TPA: TlpA disulfide reductase family protein, partial [Xanthomonadaceae bacterium]|nr:TlpA disulfide reductase family protein [Xanthomonadaceae bacterium]
ASEGDIVGPLALTDLDGKPQQLPATGAHRVLVNVWASWCGPCRDEMPLLSGLGAKALGAQGIIVVGLAQDDSASVRSYLLRTPVNYRILLDDAQGHAGLRLGNRLGVLPYSVLIDADGRLLRRKYGPFADADALAAWVTAP